MKSYIPLLFALPLVTALDAVENLSYFSLLPRFPQGSISGSDGRCGASFKSAICTGSAHGDCCSQKGYCGSTAAHCQEGCQAGFGTCQKANGGQSTSTSGNCGLSGGFELTCIGSEWGDCCSATGFCGKETAYCGEGCNPLYGKCSGSGGSSPKPSTIKSPSFTTTKVQPTPSPQPEPETETPPVEETSPPANEVTPSPTAIVVVSQSSSTMLPSSSSEYLTPTSATRQTTKSKTSQLTTSTVLVVSSSSSEELKSSSSTILPPSSTSSNARLTATDASSSPQTASPAPAVPSQEASSGMSTGAKAGVAIGVVVLAGIFFLAFFIIRRRRTAHAESPPQYADSPGEFYDYKSTAKLEQDKGNFFEMDTKKYAERDNAAVELASPVSAAEEAAAKERARIARVDDRAAAGYGGAYRGN